MVECEMEDNGTSVGLSQPEENDKEAALLTLIKETGYPMFQENGQRKFGPCPFWDGPIPGRGCEVFVGKLPRDCYEDELVPVLSRAGTIYELRLMMEFSGSNRGFCFVTYTKMEEAKKAVRELNNLEIRKGKFLGVCQSVDNCRLFVGGLPRDKKRQEILEEVRRLADGVVDCIVYCDVRDKTKNRGFAFVEFESHRAAAMARRKLVGNGPVQMWGQQIAIDWAEPELEVDEDIMSQVKILYVRNLTTETTEEAVEKVCNEATKRDNAVERVKKLRDYAFVHFRERNDAISAMKELNGSVLDGAVIEVVLAKPVDKSSVKKQEPSQLIGLPGMTYFQGNSLVTSSVQDDQSANTSRELLGRNPLVMGTREGSKGRIRGAGGIGRIYSQARAPYKKVSTEGRTFGIYPAGMEVVIASPFIFSPPLAQAKRPTQILDDICLLNGWGQPLYQMFSILKPEGGIEVHFYFCELLIPSFPNLIFRPPVFSIKPEEAKDSVAQCALLELSKKGLICTNTIASSSLNPSVAPLPALIPPSPPVPGTVPMLTAQGGIYANTQFVQTSPQFMLTNDSYGDLQPEFTPPSSLLSVVASPTYFVSSGKAPIGGTIPVVNSISYATVPTYKF